MNFILTTIALIAFPFLSVFTLQKMNILVDEVSVPAVMDGAERAGKIVETEKTAESAEVAAKMLPLAPLRPVKKEGVADLVISTAHSSIILDVDSGTILHYHNGREKRQIASLTKLMTAILVMEKVTDLDAEVAISEEAVYIEGTKVGCPRSGYCIGERLKVGERLRVKDLLKAMLMNSANDAALSLGKHIAGTEEKFAAMMNEKAQEMGLKDSNFCTASGLEIDGRESECYSTAYDIARIAAYSMKYNLIWEIMRLPSNTVISSCDGKYQHEILNTDVVMDQIPNRLGGKTGFTPLAGHSLLMAASDFTKKHRVVAVTLDDPYRWQDVKEMLGWAFGSHDWQ